MSRSLHQLVWRNSDAITDIAGWAVSQGVADPACSASRERAPSTGEDSLRTLFGTTERRWTATLEPAGPVRQRLLLGQAVNVHRAEVKRPTPLAPALTGRILYRCSAGPDSTQAVLSGQGFGSASCALSAIADAGHEAVLVRPRAGAAKQRSPRGGRRELAGHAPLDDLRHDSVGRLLSGHNLRLSWRVSLANQALWLGFIVASGTWGLLPLTLSLSAMFASHLAGPPSSYLGVRLEPEGPKEEVAVRRRAHCGVATLAPALIALQGRGSSRKPAGDGGRRVRGALPRLRALGGKGYPAGVAGEAVPLAIRVVSVARDAELWSRPAKWPRPPMSSLGGGATHTTRSLAMRSWPTASTGWRRSVTIRAMRCSMPSRGPWSPPAGPTSIGRSPSHLHHFGRESDEISRPRSRHVRPPQNRRHRARPQLEHDIVSGDRGDRIEKRPFGGLCVQPQAASGPDQAKGKCLLDRPGQLHLKPKASTTSSVAVAHVAICPGPTSAPGAL